MYPRTKIFKIKKWKSVKNVVKSCNPTFYDCADPVMEILSRDELDYVYEAEYQFGEFLIREGRMISHNSNELIFKFETQEEFSTHLVFDINRFKNDCERSTDHPLSLVIENFVEVYSTNTIGFSNINSEKIYEFPLNIISKGDLFGVFGTLDLICGKLAPYKQNWFVTAGKKCILPLIPYRDTKIFGNSLIKLFNEYGIKSYKYEPGLFYQYFIKVLATIEPSWKTKILIFPEHFYLNSEYQNFDLNVRLNKLQNLLFKKGYEQQQLLRESLWEDRTLKELLPFSSNEKLFEYVLSCYKYLRKIENREAYLLKTINHNDGILSDVLSAIISDFRKANLLKVCFPYIFHYDHLKSEKDWGVFLFHLPPLNMALPIYNKSSDIINIFKRIIEFIEDHKEKNMLTYEPYLLKNVKLFTSTLDDDNKIESGAFYKKFLNHNDVYLNSDTLKNLKLDMEVEIRTITNHPFFSLCCVIDS